MHVHIVSHVKHKKLAKFSDVYTNHCQKSFQTHALMNLLKHYIFLSLTSVLF